MQHLFFKRLLAVPFAAILLSLTFLLTATPVFAAAGASISISPNSATAGKTTPITLKGSGWAPGETVVFTLDKTAFNPPASLKADQKGKFNVKTTLTLVAGLKSGKHTIEATGVTSKKTATTTFTVKSSSKTKKKK